MRLIAILAALALAGCGNLDPPPPATYVGAGPVVVMVANEAGLDRAQVQTYIEAQNRQLANEFAQAWGVQAQLMLDDGSPGHPHLYLQQVIAPPWDQVQGVHLADAGYVSISRSRTWQVTASHEVLELLVGGREVCDPVAPYGYDGNQVADFVLPSYYQPGSTGPWDHLGKVQTQGVPAPGGI